MTLELLEELRAKLITEILCAMIKERPEFTRADFPEKSMVKHACDKAQVMLTEIINSNHS